MLQQHKNLSPKLAENFRKQVKIMPTCARAINLINQNRISSRTEAYLYAYDFGREEKNLTLIHSFIAKRRNTFIYSREGVRA